MSIYSIKKDDLLDLINLSLGVIPEKITIYLYQLLHSNKGCDSVDLPCMIHDYVTDRIMEVSEG